jgi:two-component system OmpR family response regulator
MRACCLARMALAAALPALDAPLIPLMLLLMTGPSSSSMNGFGEVWDHDVSAVFPLCIHPGTKRPGKRRNWPVRRPLFRPWPRAGLPRLRRHAMPAPHHILIVDDDEDITQLLGDYLSRFGFETHVADDGEAMRQRLAQTSIDLVVLDLMLPGEDGLTLGRELRRLRMPLIMLTARSNPYDRVLGLESGADDYVSKPFEPRELVARIEAVLRRASCDDAVPAHAELIRFDGWVLHREHRCLTSPAGLTVSLSNAEFRLLSTFLQTPRRLFSRDQLIERARGRTMDSFERSIDLLVSRLRQKLSDDPREPRLIQTVRGAGYLFNVQSVTPIMAATHA